MGGKYTGHIKWQMTVMVKNLLLEEFPIAEKEIKVIDSPEFESHVEDYVNTVLLKK